MQIIYGRVTRLRRTDVFEGLGEGWKIFERPETLSDAHAELKKPVHAIDGAREKSTKHIVGAVYKRVISVLSL